MVYRRASFRVSVVSTAALAAALALIAPGAAFAQAAEDEAPTPPPPPETPVKPFDVVVTSGGFNGGLNDILRFNGATGEFLGSFADFTAVPNIDGTDTPILNDPRDIVLSGDPFDPSTQVLVNVGFAPPMEGNDLTLSFNQVGEFQGVFADLGDSGFFVDPGGAVFGPGGDFFVGSRTEGTVFQFDGTTGAFEASPGVPGGGFFDPADIDFPRGFVFDSEGNLFIGNGANPVTGAGQNSIFFVDNATRELTVFAAPADFSPLDVILSPDGTKLVVSSENPFTGGSLEAANPGSIFIFDLETGEVEQILMPTNPDGSAAILAPRGLGFAPDGTLFSSSTGNGTIFRFDIETGEFLGTFAQIFTFDADGNVTGNINGQALNFIGVFSECAQAGSTVTCERGIDLDGFSTADDAITAVLEDGAFLEGTLDLSGDGNTVNIAEGATISVEDDRGIDVGTSATVNNNGFVESTNDDAIRLGSGSTLVNNGTIFSDGDEAVEASGENDVTVINNGLIFAGENGDKGIEAVENLTVINTGTIVSTVDEAIESEGPGLFLDNSGEIFSPLDDAVDGDDQVTIINSGLIQGGENDGLELNSGTITNSGTIESLSSDPEGDFSDAELTNRELDAAIDFDGGGDDAAGLVTNLEGGLIIGDIGINASSGNFVSDGMGGSVAGSPANFGDQTVVNFGTITGRIVNPATGSIDAVLLSFGDDEFQQWSGAVVNGRIGLEAGDDTFILEGTASSVTGLIDGGTGTDLAILAGDLDADNFVNFETFRLGSTLGDTLSDLTISGDRTLDGDVVHVGEVTLGLGVDSLTATGSITLEEGAVLTIETPLDEALVGQTVVVLQEGTTFTDNGAIINIIDDDLLLEYTPIFGSLSVAVSFADSPVIGSSDPNVVAFGDAINAGILAGTIGGATFATLNDLDVFAFETALIDALPSLSDGEGREVFETASAASDALDRHLASEGETIWGEVIVRGADQDALSLSASGYDSDQIIFTLGGDVALTDRIRVGALVSYADIENDEVGTGTQIAEIEIDSVKIGLYTAIDLFDRGFLNAEVAYLTGDVESERGGVLGSVFSNYDFDGIMARATFGYDVLPDENVRLVPSVGVNVAQIDFDDAQETGGFNFLVERGDAEYTELRAGLELGALLSEGVDAFIKGTVIHDTDDEPRSFLLSSAELPTFSAFLPIREDDRFELAAGVDVEVSQFFTINIGYQGDFNEGYDGHSGRAKLTIGF